MVSVKKTTGEKKAITKKATAKKTVVKKGSTKKGSTKKGVTKKNHRATTPGLTYAQKRSKVLSALKRLGATSSKSDKSSAEIAKSASLTPFDVYCACYHANPLSTEGLVAQTEYEGERGLRYYLTSKGVKAASASAAK